MSAREIVQLLAAMLVVVSALVTGWFGYRAARKAGEATKAAASVQAEVDREGQFIEGLLQRLASVEAENTSMRLRMGLLEEEQVKVRRENQECAYQVRLSRDYIGTLTLQVVALGGQPSPPPFGLASG